MVVGLVAAAGTTHVLRAMLFETAPTDLATFVAVPVVLGAVAVVASCVPAIRASRTDPSLVMRAE
jgi:ABC-type lipoprotein release transport system permease subunit